MTRQTKERHTIKGDELFQELLESHQAQLVVAQLAQLKVHIAAHDLSMVAVSMEG